MAAYASLVTGRFGGHISHGAQTKNELTFQPDHLVGADQLPKYVDINIIAAMSKQTTPPAVPYDTTLRVRDACLCLHTQRAARALARRFDAAFRPLNLTNGQFSLLMSLNRPTTPTQGPPTQGAIASLLAMDRTTLTAALKPLAERGLIAIAPNPADRRNRLLSLTEAGQDLLAQAVPIWEREHAVLEATLPLSQPHLLRANLVTLSAAPVPVAKPAPKR